MTTQQTNRLLATLAGGEGALTLLYAVQVVRGAGEPLVLGGMALLAGALATLALGFHRRCHPPHA